MINCINTYICKLLIHTIFICSPFERSIGATFKQNKISFILNNNELEKKELRINYKHK